MNEDTEVQGLNGLARSRSWFEGHFGAALLGGAGLLERPDLSEGVKAGVREQMAWAVKEQPHLFVPIAPSEIVPRDQAEAEIVAALRPNVSELWISGHGVIYGAAALRAIREIPEAATRDVVDGMVSLLAKTRKDRKNRYLGVEDYTAIQVTPAEVPEYGTIGAMYARAFHEAKELYKDGTYGSAYYYFTAEKLHGITYAHAIGVLWNLGYQELAREAFGAHRIAVKLNRIRPDNSNEHRNVGPEGVTPFQATYWEKDHFDDHALKLALAGLEILDTLSPELRAEVYDESNFWGPFMR